MQQVEQQQSEDASAATAAPAVVTIATTTTPTTVEQASTDDKHDQQNAQEATLLRTDTTTAATSSSSSSSPASGSHHEQQESPSSMQVQVEQALPVQVQQQVEQVQLLLPQQISPQVSHPLSQSQILPTQQPPQHLSEQLTQPQILPTHQPQSQQQQQLLPSYQQDPALADLLERLKLFLATAPSNWDPDQTIKRFSLPNAEYISCVLWNNLFHITGTDIVRSLIFRFHAFGRPVKNVKKFEEGVFSDLRNLKPGIDATLEDPRSEFLEMLYKNNCIRTQKKQKVFYWFSVPHDRLFMDALERDLKREALGIEPTTVALHPMPLLPTLELAKQQCMPTLQIKPDLVLETTITNPPDSAGDVMKEWLNDSPLKTDPPPLHAQANFQHQPQHMQPPDLHFDVPTDSSQGTPYLTHASPEVSHGGAITSSPSLSAASELHGPEHDYMLPPPTGVNGGTPMFALFEGSPNYKQRRRAQSLFSMSKPQAPPVNARMATTPEPPKPASAVTKKRHEEKRNYCCTAPQCGRRFKRYEHLRRHIRCHTGEKPYQCPVEGCEKGFSRSDNLSQHMKVHNAHAQASAASSVNGGSPSFAHGQIGSVPTSGSASPQQGHQQLHQAVRSSPEFSHPNSPIPPPHQPFPHAHLESHLYPPLQQRTFHSLPSSPMMHPQLMYQPSYAPLQGGHQRIHSSPGPYGAVEGYYPNMNMGMMMYPSAPSGVNPNGYPEMAAPPQPQAEYYVQYPSQQGGSQTQFAF
ncbi:homeodomain transcription factor ste12 [Gaertneriomyces sp. JEL0708]|nr:homeodomain transcription factor ste12 [Gaertneriomyces sp. JEL0708]